MKPRLKTICALLIAGALAGAWVQRSALSKVRANNQRLREQSREAQRLAAENASLDLLREENRELRQQLANRTDEVARIAEKLTAAKSRIEALLTQIPETET